MSDEVIFDPDLELLKYLRSKGSWHYIGCAKYIAGRKENCDLCGRPVGMRVIFQTSDADPQVHTCALGVCGARLIGESEWNEIAFKIATLGEGLNNFSRAGYDENTDRERNKELVDRVYHWAKNAGKEFPAIVVSILSFYSERGFISWKQREILENFVIECKRLCHIRV